jgi:hypothetical protein
MPQPTPNAQLYFRLCSDHISIEAVPKKQLSLDLSWIRDNRIRDYDLLMWTPHFVVLRTATGEEVTVRKNGRMLVRKAASEKTAKNIASTMLGIVLEGPLKTA